MSQSYTKQFEIQINLFAKRETNFYNKNKIKTNFFLTFEHKKVLYLPSNHKKTNVYVRLLEYNFN